MFPQDLEPPYDELAERAVLGAAIVDPETMPTILESLREEDFYVEKHRLLFSLLYRVWEDKGKDWDDIVLKDYIEKRGLKDKLDMGFIYALAEEAATGPLLEEAIRSVKERAGLRRLMELSLSILRGIKEEPDLTSLLDLLNAKLIEISEKHLISQYWHIREVARIVIEIIEKHRKQEKLITGRATGFLDLDTLTTGFHPSDLIIVAARPGMGKSSFMLSMAMNMSLQEKVPVAIYSLEMSKEQLVMRALSMLSGVPLQNIRRGFINEEDRNKLISSALDLSKCEIYIDDTPGLSTTDLRIKTRKLRKEKGVEVVFIDYLQLLRSSTRRSSRQEEVAEISRNLKALAKELNIPVVALAQLSRQVEHRADKRPQLADLRECITGDTLIICAEDGRLATVRELYETGKKIKVYSLDLKSLKLVVKPVEKVVFSGYKEVYELRTRSGRTIKASSDHPFLTPEGWKQLKDLKVGDYVAVVERYPEPEGVEEYPEDLCWFIGCMIGDGSFIKHRTVSFCTSEDRVSEEMIRISEKYFGITPRHKHHWSGTKHLEFTIKHYAPYKNPVINFFRDIGLLGFRDHEKRLPDVIYGSQYGCILELISGLIQTDGSITSHNGCWRVKYTSTSRRLLDGLLYLFLRLGILPVISKETYNTKSKKPIRELYIRDKRNLLKLLTNIRLYGVKEIKRLMAIESIGNSNGKYNLQIGRVPSLLLDKIFSLKKEKGLSWRKLGYRYQGKNMDKEDLYRIARLLEGDELIRLATSDIFFDRIVSIEPKGIEPTYDLVIPETHNFVANHMVVHNSGQIEQDADLIIFIHRPEYYKKNPAPEEQGIAELIVAKQRQGPTGIVKVAFVKETASFKPLIGGAVQPVESYEPEEEFSEEDLDLDF